MVLDNKLTDCHPLLQAAFPLAVAEWIAKYPTAPKPVLNETYRSMAVQAGYYAQGRTKPGAIITNAKPGTSPHNYLPSYAFDVAFKKPDGSLDWSDKWFRLFAPFMLKHAGVDWGGNWQSFKDLPHFEVHNWRVIIKSKLK